MRLSVLPGQGDGMQLDETLPRRLRRLRQGGDNKDIFCMVKQQMCDTSLIQRPLLVWPSNFVASTESFWNCVNSTNSIVQQSLEEVRTDELRRLADALEKDFPHMHRAVHYYRSLVSEDKPRKPYSTLKFIAAGPNAFDRVANVQLGQRPPPPRPRPLQVVFHR